MFRWQPLEPFQRSAIYSPGASPADHHPAQWGKLEHHCYGALHGPAARLRVAVHSTRRSRDGWTYNVAELAGAPMWVSYFHNLQNGARIEHARSANAEQLAQALSVFRLG
jgi:hypothetical protein